MIRVIRITSCNFRVTVADINDEVPVFEEREECTMITEFHRPRETITVVRATDGDDIDSPNGRILFSIEGGNEKGEFLTFHFKISYGDTSVLLYKESVTL